MTVVAWTKRDGIMAADRMISFRGVDIAPQCKLIIGADKQWWYVAALAGTGQGPDQERAIVTELLTEKTCPKMPGDYDVIVYAINKINGAKIFISCGQEGEDRGVSVYTQFDMPEYFAMGAGTDFALGAMHAGSTAVGAVQAANEHSPKCGRGYDYARFDGTDKGFIIT